MAYRPPNRTPVLNLGKAKNDSDNNGPSFHKFLNLPAELRMEIYKHYIDDLGPVPPEEHDNQPPLTRASSLLRKEALPLFYSHATFAAGVDIWPPLFEPTTLDINTITMLGRLSDEHLARIRHVKLTVDFDKQPVRRFVVSLDLTQWRDQNHAIRIERTIPAGFVRYEDAFRTGMEEAMQILFDDVRPRSRDRWRVRCFRVLSAVETALDLVFYDDEDWSKKARKECREIVRNIVKGGKGVRDE